MKTYSRFLFLFIVTLLMAGLFAPVSQASTPAAPVYAKVNGSLWGFTTLHSKEGSPLPSVEVFGSDMRLQLQRFNGGSWANVESIVLPPTPAGEAASAVRVPVPLNPAYVHPASPQRFRLVNEANGMVVTQSPEQSFVVFKKAHIVPSIFNGRWGWRKARFSACRVITYRVDVRKARGSNAKALTAAKKAANRLSQASGMKFKYKGTASVSNSGRSYASGADITIKFGEIPGSNDPAGLATAVYSSLRGTSELYRMQRVKIVIDQSKSSSVKYRDRILLHELMHGLGLSHSKSKKDLMHHVVYTNTLSDADKQGLKVVGANAGCF